MTDNGSKGVYNREVQLRYNQGRLQMSFRFAKDEKEIEMAVRKYMEDNDFTAGGLAKIAVIEKMISDGYLIDQETDQKD